MSPHQIEMWGFLLFLLIVVSLSLIHYRMPSGTGVEGFALAAVDPVRMPLCTEHSTDAQALLARFATVPATDETAAELRLLVSKMCCITADITSPYFGVPPRAAHLPFRASHDLEEPGVTVGRCRMRSIPARDVEIALDKYRTRGEELIRLLSASSGDGAAAAFKEFDGVLARLKEAFRTCEAAQPSLDHPSGARDLGYWEAADVANLSAYKGISASA